MRNLAPMDPALLMVRDCGTCPFSYWDGDTLACGIIDRDAGIIPGDDETESDAPPSGFIEALPPPDRALVSIVLGWQRKATFDAEGFPMPDPLREPCPGFPGVTVEPADEGDNTSGMEHL